jgi:glycosyltransferase involved in cell wall biosynthesis
MKILQIAHCFPPESMTGAEIYAYNLSKELSKNHHISVFYRINDPSGKEYEVIKASYEGLDVYKINNTLKESNSLDKIYRNKKVEEKFSEVLDSVKPDVAHVHHLLFLSTGMLDELKSRGIPVVFTLHDYWLVCPRGQMLKNNFVLCGDPLSADCFRCLACGLNLKTILKKAVKFFSSAGFAKKFRVDIKDICGKVDLFIAPSKYLQSKFIKFGVSEDKIFYSDNGMDSGLFRDMEKIKSDKIRIGFIGTLIPSKGVHTLIKAFNKIKSDAAVLKIYGKAPVNNGIFDYARKIKRMAGKNKNIKFMGVFGNKDAGNVFKEIDILVFPSLWEENSPLVLHEAILTKTPVIASDIGGAPEFVRDKRFLFKAGDAEDLSGKMDFFIKNPAVAKDTNGSIFVKNIRENAEEMEKIYEGLIKNAKTS